MFGDPVTRHGWRVLLGAVATQRRALVRLAGWSALEALPALLSGHLVARAVDRGFLAGRVDVGFGWLGLLAATAVVGAFGTRMTYPALGQVAEQVRDTMLRRVVRGTLHQAAAAGRGDTSTVAKLTQQVEAIRDVVGSLLMTLRRFLFVVGAATVGLASLHPAVAAIALPPLVLSLVLFLALLATLASRQRAVLVAEETLARSTGEVITGARDVSACGAAERALDMVGTDVLAQARAARALGAAGALRSLATAVGSHLPILLLVLALPYLLRNGVSPGEVLGAITYLSANLEPAVRSLTQTLAGPGLRLTVTLRRLAEESIHVRPAPAPSTRRRPRDHRLVLDAVTFAYSEHAEPVIRDLSLDIDYGEHLAIVGPSGIGKSTLANLLAGLASPQHGRILLGGQPLRDVSEDVLRRDLALIPQEAYVFAGTVRENLTYLRPDVTDEELDRAAAALDAQDLLHRLGGYDGTFVPSTLSAGERQRIALIRAYVSPARILILDEATCHLDPRAEACAEDAFARRGTTLVVIAHRISSARRARHILLLDGTRASLGSHEDLLATSALYADLVGHWDAGLTPEPAGR